MPDDRVPSFWTLTGEELLHRLGSERNGLSTDEAAARLLTAGPNRVRSANRLSRLRVIVAQFRSPLLLLLFAATISGLTSEWIDATIVLLVVAATVSIGYVREYSAQSAAAALERRLRVQTVVVRQGPPRNIPIDEAVPGDVVQLSAGSLLRTTRWIRNWWRGRSAGTCASSDDSCWSSAS